MNSQKFILGGIVGGIGDEAAGPVGRGGPFAGAGRPGAGGGAGESWCGEEGGEGEEF